MLSLDKTKDVEALRDFIGEQKTLLSWKLDGLTVVLTYENGMLTRAVTRGNGEIGEVKVNFYREFTRFGDREIERTGTDNYKTSEPPPEQAEFAQDPMM